MRAVRDALVARVWMPVARTLDVLLVVAAAFAPASAACFPLSHAAATTVACFLFLGGRLVIAGLTHDRSLQRVILAAAIGMGGAWSSVGWNTDSTDDLPVMSWEAWRAQRGLSATPYETLAVGGWPLQRIEGHGRGGAPERLLPEKGLLAMHANTACWLGGALLVSLAIGPGWLPVACAYSLLLGFAAFLGGFFRLVWMLD